MQKNSFAIHAPGLHEPYKHISPPRPVINEDGLSVSLSFWNVFCSRRINSDVPIVVGIWIPNDIHDHRKSGTFIGKKYGNTKMWIGICAWII